MLELCTDRISLRRRCPCRAIQKFAREQGLSEVKNATLTCGDSREAAAFPP